MTASATANATPIDFYFDFISPFGYFASRRIDALAAQYGRSTVWRPMLLGVSVLKVMGLPALPDTPLKGPYILNEVRRYARYYGLTLARDTSAPPMNPLPAARFFHWLRQKDYAIARQSAAAILDAYWLEGRNMADPAELAKIAAPHGIGADAVTAALADPAVSQGLRAEVDASIKRGVFGSPFFFVDGEPFWGNDSFEMMTEWLKRGGW